MQIVRTQAARSGDLTRINLPDGTAAELCSHLRRQSADGASAGAGHRQRAARRRRGWPRCAPVPSMCMDKPVNETLLLGRVRNMIRAYHKFAEWHMRDETSCALGLAEAPAEFTRPPQISLIGMEAAPLQGWVRQLLPRMRRAIQRHPDARCAMASLHTGAPPMRWCWPCPTRRRSTDECLRLISTLRASALTRDVALLVIQKTPDPLRATSALDMGADDVMTGGFDADELALRLQVLLRRKRQVAQMLQTVRTGLREVVNDPLTGLYNRRYAMPFLTRLIESAAAPRAPFAVILADMDHFKRINDAYGHASGDAVLVETARRLRSAVRGGDMVARIGGEEFVIAMPATDLHTRAQHRGPHLCVPSAACPSPFPVQPARSRHHQPRSRHGPRPPAERAPGHGGCRCLAGPGGQGALCRETRGPQPRHAQPAGQAPGGLSAADLSAASKTGAQIRCVLFQWDRTCQKNTPNRPSPCHSDKTLPNPP